MDETLKYIDLGIEGVLRRVKALEAQEPQYSPVQFVSVGPIAQVMTLVYTDIPGATLDIEPGTYLINGTATIDALGAGDYGHIGYVQLMVGAVAQALVMELDLEFNSQATLSQQWFVTVTVTTTIKLQTSKSAGVGTSTVTNATLSSIEAG